MMQLKAFNGLNETTLEDLKQLVQTCEQHDGISAKIYWHMINRQRKVPGDYCLYSDNQLIAYLGTYYFEEDTIEICALVHPQHRRTGIFTELYNFARAKLIDIDNQYLMFSCPTENSVSKQYLKSSGSKLAYKEYSLVRNNKAFIEFSPKHDLELILATKDDVAMLAELDGQCFNSNFQDMLTRFVDTIEEEHRKVWLIKHDDEYVGKIHARLDNGAAYLHDLCILPQFQEQGIAHQMLKQTINALYMSRYKKVYSEVQTISTKPLQLFLNCGFEIARVDEFWRFETRMCKITPKAYEATAQNLH